MMRPPQPPQPQTPVSVSRHSSFAPFAPFNPSPLSLSPSPSSRKTHLGSLGDSSRGGGATFYISSPTPASRVPSSPSTPLWTSPSMSRNDENQRPGSFHHIHQNGLGNMSENDSGNERANSSHITTPSFGSFNFNFQAQQQQQQQQQSSPSSPLRSSLSPSKSPFSRRSTPTGTSHVLSSRSDLLTRRSAFLNRVRQSRSDAHFSARHDSLTRMEYLSWIEDRRKEIESLKKVAPDLSAMDEELEREEEEVRKLVDWEQGLIEELEKGEPRPPAQEEMVGFDDQEYDEIFEDLLRTGEVNRLEPETHRTHGHEDDMDVDMD
ncbi:hypothetical protein KEM56_001868 [Ascosphaera pollenicola]|nr:hypothetical protein KEM56_001868 [Ascosphaera pollenicola]